MPNNVLTRVRRGFRTFAAAARAANAVEAGRAPNRADLRDLDIDPESFRNIRL